MHMHHHSPYLYLAISWWVSIWLFFTLDEMKSEKALLHTTLFSCVFLCAEMMSIKQCHIKVMHSSALTELYYTCFSILIYKWICYFFCISLLFIYFIWHGFLVIFFRLLSSCSKRIHPAFIWIQFHLCFRVDFKNVYYMYRDVIIVNQMKIILKRIEIFYSWYFSC